MIFEMRIKILVVDDEPDENEGIIYLLEKLDYDFEIFSAADGLAALQILHKNVIDILFTDIRMPFMDGLELTQEALALYPHLYIILYSGHSDFAYARQAISLGVSDYILKPLDTEEFTRIMSKAAKQIMSSVRDTYMTLQNQSFARKHILFKAVNNTLPLLTEQEKTFFTIPYRRMILLEFADEFFDKIGEAFEDTLLSTIPCETQYLNLNMCQSVLFFPSNTIITFESLMETALLIQHFVRLQYDRDCYLAMSRPMEDFKELPIVFAELEHLMERRFFESDTSIFYETDSVSVTPSMQKSEEALHQQIQKNIQGRDISALKTQLALLFQYYETKNRLSHIYIKFIFSSLYKDIMFNLSSDTSNEEHLSQIVQIIYKTTDLRKISEIIEEALEKIDRTHSLEQRSSKHEIQMIIQYISTHYGEALDLQTLSSLVFLSPRYLCTLFKREMNCGLNKYIKTFRMEKAKELLETTTMKIISIAIQVGYSNLSYFCQSFKEFYGDTPEKYRQNTIGPEERFE